MTDDPFEPIGVGQPRPLPAKSPAWTTIIPVPPEAPQPPNHPDLGKPTARWIYRDSEGQLLGYVSRFDVGGTKQFRPQIFMQPLWLSLTRMAMAILAGAAASLWALGPRQT